MDDKPLSNNAPFTILELTEEQHRFVLGNCDTNIQFCLNALQNLDMSRPSVEKLVALMEQFKTIRTMLKKQHPEVDS